MNAASWRKTGLDTYRQRIDDQDDKEINLIAVANTTMLIDKGLIDFTSFYSFARNKTEGRYACALSAIVCFIAYMHRDDAILLWPEF